MDSYGDHALTCPCHGDRTVRHNAIRDAVYDVCRSANMNPEREKAGLLPARPLEDGLQCSTDQLSSNADETVIPRGRRPADVYLPRGTSGSPMALDFACTSALRADRMHQASRNPVCVISEYEDFKREFRAQGDTESTERQCANQGFRFVPMVLEAHSGGWGKAPLQIFDAIAKALSATSPDSSEASSLRIAQRLSISLQRENARAIWKRVTDTTEGDGEVASMEQAPQLPTLW